jgi:MFS transporter, PAT family, beta-lactamase induction signal transducer AmpG
MTETAANKQKPPKPSVWKSFSQPAAWTMFSFGFASGLPFLLVAGTLAYWLKEHGIALKEITWIASAGMTYALKFLWAPLLDNMQVPVFAKLGRRRSWLLLAQIGVVIGLVAMAWITPTHLGPFVVFTLLLAFAGATQDIAVDAYRIEIAPVEDQGALTAVYSLGYRIALIITGMVALLLADHTSWSVVYQLMGMLMLIPIVANLRAKEPEYVPKVSTTWRQTMRASVIEPFSDFFSRYGWQTASLLLLFILLFKIPEQALVGGIMSPFYLDMGFSKTQIGTITKLYGVWIGIAGVFAGGMAIARWGVRGPLFWSVFLTALCNLTYFWLIAHPGNLIVLTGVISIENFALGFLGTAAVAFLSSLVNKQHTATQYALLSSMVNLPGKVLGIFAGGIVEATSYGTYFVIATLAVIPAVVLMLVLWKHLKAQTSTVASPKEKEEAAYSATGSG